MKVNSETFEVIKKERVFRVSESIFELLETERKTNKFVNVNIIKMYYILHKLYSEHILEIKSKHITNNEVSYIKLNFAFISENIQTNKKTTAAIIKYLIDSSIIEKYEFTVNNKVVTYIRPIKNSDNQVIKTGISTQYRITEKYLNNKTVTISKEADKVYYKKTKQDKVELVKLSRHHINLFNSLSVKYYNNYNAINNHEMYCLSLCKFDDNLFEKAKYEIINDAVNNAIEYNSKHTKQKDLVTVSDSVESYLEMIYDTIQNKRNYINIETETNRLATTTALMNSKLINVLIYPAKVYELDIRSCLTYLLSKVTNDTKLEQFLINNDMYQVVANENNITRQEAKNIFQFGMYDVYLNKIVDKFFKEHSTTAYEFLKSNSNKSDYKLKSYTLQKEEAKIFNQIKTILSNDLEFFLSKYDSIIVTEDKVQEVFDMLSEFINPNMIKINEINDVECYDFI